MVAAVANTRVSILRGTTTDAYGDIQDAEVALYTGVPAALVETARTAFDPSTQTPRTVRSITCVIPDGLSVTNSDQILDEPTQQRYAIEEILRPPTLIGAPVDIVLTLRRVTGITT